MYREEKQYMQGLLLSMFQTSTGVLGCIPLDRLELYSLFEMCSKLSFLP